MLRHRILNTLEDLIPKLLDQFFVFRNLGKRFKNITYKSTGECLKKMISLYMWFSRPTLGTTLFLLKTKKTFFENSFFIKSHCPFLFQVNPFT